MRVYIDGHMPGKKESHLPCTCYLQLQRHMHETTKGSFEKKVMNAGKGDYIADPLPWHVSIVFPKIQNAITIGVITSISARINTMDRDNPDILFV